MIQAPSILVVPRNQLSKRAKALLTKGGIIAIEVDDPKEVTFLSAKQDIIPADKFLISLIESVLVHQSAYVALDFLKKLLPKLQEQK